MEIDPNEPPQSLDDTFLLRLDAVVKARANAQPPEIRAQIKEALEVGDTGLDFSVDERGNPTVTVLITDKPFLTVPIMSLVSPEEIGPVDFH